MTFTVLLVAVLAMDTTPTNCDPHRAVVHSLDPQRLYRTRRTESQVIADGRHTEVVEEAWLRRLLGRIKRLPLTPKRRVARDIRLVVVLECGEDKPIRLALPATCESLEINSAQAPYDPELFDLILQKIHEDHNRAWASVGAFCKQQLKKLKPIDP
jgi:hypothetical protein